MRIIITGQSKGVGKYLYEYFTNQGHEVIGISRETGYDFTDSNTIDRITELECDLFINNTYYQNVQSELVNRLYKKTKMVVFGSNAGDYGSVFNDEYSFEKKKLQHLCKQLAFDVDAKLLYLHITFLEDALTSDVKVSYNQVCETIEYWLSNPYFSRIDYDWKLTDYTKQQLKDRFNITL